MINYTYCLVDGVFMHAETDFTDISRPTIDIIHQVTGPGEPGIYNLMYPYEFISEVLAEV